jgi:threonine dehydrogenase-like Zn-dependent dehydrogenase
VCSTAQAELVRSVGADEVVDYTREDVSDGSRHWDLVLDCAGRRTYPLGEVPEAIRHMVEGHGSGGKIVVLVGRRPGGGRATLEAARVHG